LGGLAPRSDSSESRGLEPVTRQGVVPLQPYSLVNYSLTA
jgi:hypothetical protein